MKRVFQRFRLSGVSGAALAGVLAGILAAFIAASALAQDASKADAPKADESGGAPAASEPVKTEPAAVPAPTADKPWVALAALPVPAADLAGVAVNGKLYLFGGRDGVRPTGLVLEYDAAADTWTRKKPMPLAVHRFAVATYGDQIYLFGGFKYPDNGANAWQPVGNAWRYDPANDAWTALAELPSKRGGAAAAVVDGRIFVIGGASVQPDTKDTAIQEKRRHAIVAAVEEYDPKANAWRARTALPTPRSEAAVAAVAGKIYVIGGRIASTFAEDGSDTDVVEAYDPARDLWSRPLARMDAPRSAMGAANWRNRIVVAGGETAGAAGVTASAAVAAYDPEANQWRTLATLPAPRRGIATGLIGDRFYVAGGTAAAQPAPAKEEAAKKTVEAPAGRTAFEALQLDVLP